MGNSIADSELILNADGSIYHLNILSEDISPTIITVGDPDRVAHVSKHFDRIEIKKQKREFVTHTGYIGKKRITVISTGIGTDNIDIVLNELDALVNIDFKTKTVKQKLRSLDIVRIGTTGSIQPEIQVDTFLMSEYAVGFDSLLHFYKSRHVQQQEIQQEIIKQTNWNKDKSVPYVVKYDEGLGKKLLSKKVQLGFTATNVGFYGPQSRKLRLDTQDPSLNNKLAAFKFKGLKITNLEMETAGIYGLSKLLGHKAVSMNCILANRANGTFSKNPEAATEKLIQYTLDKIASIQ
ncbi:nucleoside phosphorylase [Galbibacter pacificus]|uniref:Uridine phosphorylase n=1 Tax=Galbibacter pacificus TaxID=2996052 RepID=A0ABT6FQX2_9FLAO|nr:nucleoside phosphorylase [Galbibacter pacificus]MDG3581885.1 nucleoside phosphorylase [Galbibacter pacificus]MDG3585641.1 nucleoside phosphorylase [Galbibacter pacificus]